eukprot:CAMPEP_0116018790 /NCGR_PEP_ID=MMETSP0321-20121206/8854_1 /TAXON_ID=163516 /ORGANISM="Leptocylindrus danicus var. danicus, Strain B650" /LENGTH=206 /DNA_ID=CAMNT_0003489243 /DNA_START=351 /DNA_END=971 /DNA_ORIENTATION=-
MGLHESGSEDMGVTSKEEVAPCPVTSRGNEEEKKVNFVAQFKQISQYHNIKTVAPDPVTSQHFQNKCQRPNEEGKQHKNGASQFTAVSEHEHNHQQQIELDNWNQPRLSMKKRIKPFSSSVQYNDVSRCCSEGQYSPESVSVPTSPTPSSPMITRRCARNRASADINRDVVGDISIAAANNLDPVGNNSIRPVEVVQRRLLRKRVK